MALDVTKVGQLAAELMEAIADHYPDEENAQVGTVALLIEVNGTNQDGSLFTTIDWRCTDGRGWIQAGLFDAAARAARGALHSD